MADPTEQELDAILARCRETLKEVRRLNAEGNSSGELPSVKVVQERIQASFIDFGGNFIEEMPPPSMTGLEPDMTRLCAAACGQIYRVTNASQFSLTCDAVPNVQVVKYDSHGSLSETSPDFVLLHVPSEKTVILTWKGSATLMDWIHDVAFAPLGSCRFRKLAKQVRLHGGFASLAESELVNHEDFIIDFIRENDIKQVICTGHSLGGGVATTTHFMLYYMLKYDDTSYWHQKLGAEIADALTVRCVAFSAPSSIVLLRNEEVNAVPRDQTANLSVEGQFLHTLSKYSCNFIYNQDPVPRLPAHLYFIDDLVKDIIQNGMTTSLPWYVRVLPSVGEGQWVTSIYENWLEENTNDPEDSIKKLLTVALKFRHYATVIYYDSRSSPPLALQDVGPTDRETVDDMSNQRDKSAPTCLRHLEYHEAPAKENVAGSVLTNHMFLVTAPGIAYNIPKKRMVTKTEPKKKQEEEKKGGFGWLFGGR